MPKEKIKIFILEDDPIYRELYKTLIDVYVKNYDSKIDFYLNAFEAIGGVEKAGPDYWDIYICDLKVPFDSEKGSIEYFYALDLIRGFSLENVIIVSGYTSPEILKMAIDLNVMNVLGKPFHFEILVMNINYIIRNKKIMDR